MFYIEIVADSRSSISPEEQRSFNLAQNALCISLGRFLKRNEAGLSKVRIQLSDASSQALVSGPVSGFPLLFVDWPFDYALYRAIDSFGDRFAFMLRVFMDALRHAAQVLEINIEGFEQASAQVLALDNPTEFQFLGPQASPDATQTASLWMSVHEQYAKAQLRIDQLDGTCHTHTLAVVLPHVHFWTRLFHQILWLDNQTLQLCNSSGEIAFTLAHNLPPSLQLLPKNPHTQLHELIQLLAMAHVAVPPGTVS